MKSLVIYIHGKGGSAAEAERYRSLFPNSDVVGFDYQAQTPWEAKTEFARLFDIHAQGYDRVVLIANSIGAFFSMHGLAEKSISLALFISPVVDMQKLLTDMMSWANVTESDLRREKKIPTAFGETLSWEYLCYVQKHRPLWRIPTHILYGEKDALISKESVAAFAENIGASLTVMEEGEHWFHTDEQMQFLDEWIRNCLNN